MENNSRKCAQCGADFIPRVVMQRFCGDDCRKMYYKTHNAREERRSITFTCANPGCRRVVVTDTDRPDKRTRFCCKKCERNYWKNPHHKAEHDWRGNNVSSTAEK